MLIRRMSQADIASVVEIEEQCFSLPWSKKSFEDSLMREDTIFLVCEENENVTDGSTITGYMGLYLSFDEASVTNVAVSPAFRKKGYGEALVVTAKEAAKEAGAAKGAAKEAASQAEMEEAAESDTSAAESDASKIRKTSQDPHGGSHSLIPAEAHRSPSVEKRHCSPAHASRSRASHRRKPGHPGSSEKACHH